MENHRLIFAQINLLDQSIAEIIFDKDIYVSIEMMEEIETFICDALKLILVLSSIKFILTPIP
jgi:hypothetical protein